MKRRDFLKTGAATAGMVGTLTMEPTSAGAARTIPKRGRRRRTIARLNIFTAPKAIHYLPKAAGARANVSRLTDAVGGTGEAKNCAAARVLQRRARRVSERESHLRQWSRDDRIDGRSYKRANSFPPRKPAHAVEEARGGSQGCDIFPQVRQMVLAGKDREAMTLALERMNEGPIKQDTEPHLTVPAFLMQLDLPKTARVSDYLRTLDFETGEATVNWTDEHGDWVRQHSTSRPDNAVAQWLAAPAGQPMNVRIALQKSADWTMVSGMDWGSHAGINTTAPDRAAFAPSAIHPVKLRRA